MLAVVRTMQILDTLSKAPQGLGVIEIANSLNIHKADASRILSTLEEEGYVVRDEVTSLYSVAFQFIAMALRYMDGTQMDDIVRPVLNHLVQNIGESVQFAIEQNRELLYIDRVDGIKPLRVASMLGLKAPLHATAAGKVWLASLPDEEVVVLMKERGMKAVTPHTITNLEELLKNLSEVRKQGYAEAREEINPSVYGLAAPVFDRQRRVRAALVATIPAYEATAERIDVVKDGVLASAEILSQRLALAW
ncbi:IclR family transcriptional regulator [Alicyclobacillus mengziensis]|uniref:IclR family transcriptional regulator n=1 Tax=Alicyclobacillus mengziensis TaxID=2931921 RepID=A0A9X7VZD1_9BACL|nr:IclR family transcriptional regulator [Alicyclobacillus mengziensis]QSO47262.1 IclR family transcriptional regulator [Alicyclobacillus mengziensis]